VSGTVFIEDCFHKKTAPVDSGVRVRLNGIVKNCDNEENMDEGVGEVFLPAKHDSLSFTKSLGDP